MDTFPTKAGKRFAHFAAAAALAIFAAGCASGVAIRITPGFGDEPPGTESSADKAEPPGAAPRTLPQAVCAYLRCLRTCPCDRDADAKKNGEKQEGKKNPEKKNG